MAKNKNVEPMISATGFICSFIDKLLYEVKRLGGSADDIHRLVTDKGGVLITKIAQLIVDAGRKAKQPFIVIFDTAKSFEDLVKAGRYYFVNPNITPYHFPLDAEGKTEDEVYILPFDTHDTEHILTKMEEQGFRPATSTHALVFGTQYPEEQRKYPIKFLGSSWTSSTDGRYVISLETTDRNARVMYHVPFNCDQDAVDCRYAAVRK